MPPPKDLTGLLLGGLVAIRQTGEQTTPAKTQPVWECRCVTCGRVAEYTLAKINERRRKSQGCDVCARGPCVVCGGEILVPKKRACSADCSRLQGNAKAVLRYRKYVAKDPLYNIEKHRRAIAAIKADPQRHDDYLQRERERGKQRRLSPEFKLRERRYKDSTRDRRRVVRNAWYAGLSLDQRKERQSPEQRRRENELRRKSRRLAREQNALNQLAVTLGKLNNKDKING